MPVTQFRSKFFLGDYQRVRYERIPEWVKLLAGFSLTFFAPALFLCAVSGRLLPFYVMGFCWVLGSLLGVVMFRRSAASFLSCVAFVPDPPKGASAVEWKNAA